MVAQVAISPGMMLEYVSCQAIYLLHISDNTVKASIRTNHNKGTEFPSVTEEQSRQGNVNLRQYNFDFVRLLTHQLTFIQTEKRVHNEVLRDS